MICNILHLQVLWLWHSSMPPRALMAADDFGGSFVYLVGGLDGTLPLELVISKFIPLCLGT